MKIKNIFCNEKTSIILIAVCFSILFVGNISAQNENRIDQCLACHEENEMLPEGFSPEDVHMKANLTCAACHGGSSKSEDGDIAMSSANKFIGVPEKKDIPSVCGKCHSNIDYMRRYQPRIATDQTAQYYKSVHGKMLAKGDENVAECSSCHTAHNILPIKDPRSTVYHLNVPGTCNKCHGDKELMKDYGLKTNEYEEYAESVHGKALLERRDIGAPACNDCHGNHGATPPGYESVSHVCGMCHVNNEEYFKSSVMFTAFEKKDYHGCEQCHGYHKILKPTDEMIGAGEKSFCVKCHSPNDKGFKTGVMINESIVGLANLYDSAKVEMNEVKKIGMNDIEIGFALQDANQKLIESRTLVHTFDYDRISSKIDEGDSLVKSALNIAESESEEYESRKMGFVYSLMGLFLLVVGIYMKLKTNKS